MRCTKLPTTSTGVMMANVIWKTTNTDSGMLPDSAPRSSSPRNRLPRPPIQAFAPPPSPKARL